MVTNVFAIRCKTINALDYPQVLLLLFVVAPNPSPFFVAKFSRIEFERNPQKHEISCGTHSGTVIVATGSALLLTNRLDTFALLSVLNDPHGHVFILYMAAHWRMSGSVSLDFARFFSDIVVVVVLLATSSSGW